MSRERVFSSSQVSVAVQQFVACRSAYNFHRPNDFIPERWQGMAEFAHDRRQVCQPFSLGPRNCIGRQLANTEVRLILARLLWQFNLRLDHSRMQDRDWRWLVETKNTQLCHVVVMSSGLLVLAWLKYSSKRRTQTLSSSM